MALHTDHYRAGPAELGPESTVEAIARSLTPPVAACPAGLRTRLQAIADDIDGLWRDAIKSQDFALVTRAVDASHGVHRALLALEEQRFVIGGRSGVRNASALAHVDRPAS